LALVVYSGQAFTDFERCFDFLVKEDAAVASATVSAVSEAVSILERHPLIGRPAEYGLRELVVSRGKTGYVVLYRYLEANDVLLVLALRHQREAGYAPDVEP
jgi:plasmid stabilization system protein ParE